MKMQNVFYGIIIFMFLFQSMIVLLVQGIFRPVGSVFRSSFFNGLMQLEKLYKMQ